MGDWQVYPSRSRGSQMVVDQPYLVSGPPLQQPPIQVVTDPYGQQYQVLPTAYQQPSYEMVPSRPFPDQMPLQAQPWQLATAGSRQDLMPTDVDRMRTSAGDVSGYPTEKTAYDDGSYDRATGFPRWTVYAIAIVLFAVSLTVIVVLAMVCTSRTETLGRTTEKPDSFITIRPATKIPAGPADDGRTTPDGEETSEPHATTDGHRAPERKVCRTAICQERARNILDYMDDSLDPCDDFYMYACQRAIRNRPVTHIEDSWDIVDDSYKRATHQLDDLVRTLPRETMKDGAVRKMLISFASCENTGISEADKLRAFGTFLRKAGLAQWPLWPPSDSVASWNETVLNMAAEVGMSYILRLDVYLPGNALVLGDDSFLTRYHVTMRNAAKLNPVILDAYKKYIKGAAMVVNSSFTENDAAKVADEMIAFGDLVSAFNFNASLGGTVRLLTYAELQRKVPQVDWVAFSNRLLSVVNFCVSTADEIAVTSMEYLKHVIPALATVKRSTVHNYIGWKLVHDVGSLGVGALADLRRDYTATAMNYSEDAESRCRRINEELAPLPLGRVYVDAKFPPSEKEEAIRMARAVKEDFRAELSATDWMDGHTKSEAFRKVDIMKMYIGYPDEILNDAFLDKQYEFVGEFTADTPHVLVWLQLSRNALRKNLQRLRGRQVDLWTKSPEEMTGVYGLFENRLDVSAGMIVSLNMGLGLPGSCNYGCVGTLFAHEIIHAFDETASLHDADGRIRNWWTNESREEFVKREKCFIDQYSNITDELAGIKLNGAYTNIEDVADNGCIRAGYRVYKRYLEENEDMALPGLEKYTNEQMYFIAYAQIHCSLTTPEGRRRGINRHTHSPDPHRVNVPLGNFEAFSEAFHCPKNSKMNFEKRCKLW